MEKLDAGGVVITGKTSLDILDTIQYCWRLHCKGNTNEWDFITNMNNSIMKEDYIMTKSEAQQWLDKNELRFKSTMLQTDVLHKVKWFAKYGRQDKNVGKEQISLFEVL